MNFKSLLKIICYAKEFYYTIRYNQYISGHDFIELDNNDLRCEICGYISKGEK